MSEARRQLCVLGATVVVEQGRLITLRARDAQVLTVLALRHPRAVATGAVVEAIWPLGGPGTARQSVQNSVAHLRRLFGAEAIGTGPDGYRLGPGWELDTERFDADAARAASAARRGDHATARAFARRALALVHGDAYHDLTDESMVTAERVRWHHRRLDTEDAHAVAVLSLGDLPAAVAEAAALAEAEPLREIRHLLLALALYRSGQRREGLLALRAGADALRDVAGLDPRAGVHLLEAMILSDDPALVTSEPAALFAEALAAPPLAAHATTDDVFVGRAAELATIRALLDAAFDGGTLTIEIRGPDGSGKSALAQRAGVQATIDGWRVAAAACSVVPTRPLEPLGALVRQLIDHDAAAGEQVDPALLGDLAELWPGSAPGAARGDPAEAVVAYLTDHARRFPTVLVVDDAEHLTPTAARLLTRVGADGVPFVVIRVDSTPDAADTGADADIESPGVHRIGLGGLDLADTTRLVELLGDAAITPDVAAAAHAATGGNPRLVHHLAHDRRRAASGTGPRHRVERRRAAPEPGARPGVLADRVWHSALDRLGDDARHLVDLLAVAGKPLTRDVVARALPPGSPVEALVDAAVAAGVARVSGNDVEVIAAGCRAVVLGLVDDDARTDLHERLGRALDAAASGPLASAAHYLAARHRDPARAMAAAAAAGRAAAAASMHVEAATLFGAAADIAAAGVDVAAGRRLALEQAESLRRAGDPRHVDIAWDVARRAAESDDREARALAAIALCKLGPLSVAGSLDTATAEYVEAALAVTHEPALRARCASQATLFYSMSGNVERCRELYDVALEAAHRSGEPRVLLDALGSAYVSLTHPDDWPQRAQAAAEMLALAERHNDDDSRFEALHTYFSVHVQFADPLVRTTLAAQAELATALRNTGRHWMVGYQAACLAFLDGRLDESLEMAAGNYATAPVSRSRAAGTYWMHQLVVRLAQGRDAGLEGEVDAIMADQPGLPGWHAVAAWLAARRGDHARALAECDLVDGGRALPRDMAWSGAAVYLARAVAAAGDPVRAAALTELLEPYGGLMTWYGSGTVGPFDLALAELAEVQGDIAKARHHAGVAQRTVDRLAARVFQPDLDRLSARLAEPATEHRVTARSR